MTSIRLKASVSGFVLVLAVSYLVFAGVKNGWVYLMPVDQFVNQPEYHARRVRLNGKVGAAQLEVNRAGLVATFNLCGDKEQVRVTYHGVIPDLFRAHHEVVVEGQIGDDKVFHADVLMTKCASKYEAGKGQPQGHPKMPVEPAQEPQS